MTAKLMDNIKFKIKEVFELTKYAKTFFIMYFIDFVLSDSEWENKNVRFD